MSRKIYIMGGGLAGCEAQATGGEISVALRKVFGEYREK